MFRRFHGRLSGGADDVVGDDIAHGRLRRATQPIEISVDGELDVQAAVRSLDVARSVVARWIEDDTLTLGDRWSVAFRSRDTAEAATHKTSLRIRDPWDC